MFYIAYVFKEFVSNLKEEDKDKILIRLLSQGRGSLDFARDFLLGQVEPNVSPNETIPWCVCGVCSPMPT